MIKNETDVRKHLRNSIRGVKCWVEPRRGSTTGAPDCFVMVDRCIIPVECKAVRVHRIHGQRWIPNAASLKPSQIRFAEQAYAGGVDVIYLVGFVGTDVVRGTRWSLIMDEARKVVRPGPGPVELFNPMNFGLCPVVQGER